MTERAVRANVDAPGIARPAHVSIVMEVKAAEISTVARHERGPGVEGKDLLVGVR
jgi:hypothetical protein